jgi:glycosyltransferase involved in cell wall biosynthesis
MEEQHPYRSTILPVPEGESRPIWSVMIPTYNCAKYLPETLTHVLAQASGPEVMQIEVVDDCSTDNPAAVVDQIGGGRVDFYQQVKNVGHIGNFETCLNRSKGKLVHLLHGDDYVRNGFYRKMRRGFEEHLEIGAAFCRQIFMDEYSHWQSISALEQMESGILENWLARLAADQRIMTPSIVVRRDVYEKLGGFDLRLICSEDWEMWVRIAAHYPIWYEVEPLALYRMHLESNTGRHIRTGEDTKYTREAIEIFKLHLPGAMADDIARKARESTALFALDIAASMISRHDMMAAGAQIREGLKCSYSLKVIMQLVRLFIKWGKLDSEEV